VYWIVAVVINDLVVVIIICGGSDILFSHGKLQLAMMIVMLMVKIIFIVYSPNAAIELIHVIISN
jgi:hypothetical protein